MGIVEGIKLPPMPSIDKPLTNEPQKQHDDNIDVQTIEEARTVIKQLRDRCRFQTHQTLIWRKKAKMQVKTKEIR